MRSSNVRLYVPAIVKEWKHYTNEHEFTSEPVDDPLTTLQLQLSGN